MTLSVHWPADPWHNFNSGVMLTRLKVAHSPATVFPLYHDLHHIAPAYHSLMVADLRDLLINGIDVWGRLMWVGKPPSPQEYVNNWNLVLNETINTGLRKFIIHNEPVLEGWGQDIDSQRDFTSWVCAVATLLRRQYPGIILVYPGHAVQQADVDYYITAVSDATLPDCRYLFQVFGVHLYWQYENQHSPDWGARYLIYQAALDTNMPIAALEVGDSTPGRCIMDKVAHYIEWDKAAPDWLNPRVVFTLGGQGWQDFILTDEACQAIGEHNASLD